jgi:hypothetical protein
MQNALQTPGPSLPAPPVTTSLDTTGRAINAVVVVAAVVAAAVVLVLLKSYDGLAPLATALKDPDTRAAVQSIVSTTAALFGSFTTFVGTALTAYFGISATRDVARNANDTVASTTQRGAVESSALRERLAGTEARMSATDDVVAKVKTILDQTHPDDSTHSDALTRARALLS